MGKITAIIERAEDGGFSVYSKEIKGAYGYGLTEDEAKADFLEVMSEQAEFFKEKRGRDPEWLCDSAEVDYVYDLSGFFEAFPFINASRFAKAVGINGSLMRKYKGGIVVASEKQKAIIQSRYEAILERM